MRTIVIALMLVMSLAALTDQAAAQSRNEKFPYEAIIADDEVYARSGPGTAKFYPTARLRKGDRVTVIRHDPGGWFMIEPPPGSFAWVRQEFVKREEDRGIIAGDSQVVAWVGTSFGDDHYVEQRRLQPGEEIEIIGEKTLRDERGRDQRFEVNYFRIKSPKGHFRWIPGAKIVSSEKQLSAANARARGTDPFTGDTKSAPVDMASHEPSEATSVAADDKSVPTPRDPGRRPAPTPKDLEEESPPSKSTARSSNGSDTALPFTSSSVRDAQQRLAAVDQQLQETLKRETRDWDFAAIESELQDLQANEATSTAAARRLASLGKYKQVKADYDEFARLMDETNRRDAELAAAQRARLVPGTVAPIARPQTTTPSNNVRAAPLTNSNSPNRATPPGRSPAPAIQSRPAPKGRFGGAGIIQRSGANQPGLPKHVLVHPNGQRLAYLQGDGVDLDQYLGESMGLEGDRTFRPELKSDLMVVKGLQPVKLKP